MKPRDAESRRELRATGPPGITCVMGNVTTVDSWGKISSCKPQALKQPFFWWLVTIG